MTDSLRVALARHVLGDIRPESLPAVALQALLDGVESPSLSALAGAIPADSPSDLRETFESALRELGIRPPPRLQAAALLRYEYARRVVDGQVSPAQGASDIFDVFREIELELPRVGYVGEEFGISEIVGAHYALSEVAPGDAGAVAELEESIFQACARIVAEGPEP